MNPNVTLPEIQKQKFSAAITTPGYKKLIANTITDPKKQAQFVASITSAVGVTPQLNDCDPKSVIAGALLGAALGLSPSPQLGQFYLVPFKQKEKKDRFGNVIEPECQKATFILSYKGMLQLAMRSGSYRKINVLEIKQGELEYFDPLEEEIKVHIIQDPDAREAASTVGYYAMFEYLNGFRKAIYWTRRKMMAHADRYSKAFSAKEFDRLMNGEISEREMWKYSSFWYQNFDDMAKKTMLRQLISHWGIMSVEMQTAFENEDRAMTFSGADIVVDESAEMLPGQDAEMLPSGNVPETGADTVSLDEISLGDA